jgi:hypothetical protein
MIFAILGTMFLGITAVNAQVSTDLPQFKSGASVVMGVPVDFTILNQRVGAIYDVVESDKSHNVWKFTGSTGDWAFVFADGRIVVASTVEFDLATKDTLTKELNVVMDMLNLVNAGISTEARNNALDSAVYYASEQEIYHRIEYDFNSNLDLTLVVPNCTIKQARLIVNGADYINCPDCNGGDKGQFYYIDGQEVTSCTGKSYTSCDVPSVEVTDRVPPGLHKISSNWIGQSHTLIIEVITSTAPPRQFVLYGPEFHPWINESSTSMDLQALQKILNGGVHASQKAEMNTINSTKN